MPDNTITFEELQILAKEGAEIEFDRRPLQIDRLGELIEKIELVVAAQEARSQADLARSKTQLEVLATLQSLIKSQSGANKLPPLDLSPLRELIADIQAANEHRARVAYSFDVKRTGQGYIDEIVATPVGQTLN